MKKKLTLEEKRKKSERMALLKELLGDGKDLESVNESMTELKKEVIELMYDEELKHHL
ncbi:MAG: hypothetical protein LBB21_05995 [Holosporaceae bacterium]|nr:hypothetical protein [Holosporaceae bacterium]